MMEEIITLIIHEAQAREGKHLDLKLKQVLLEINISMTTIVQDLLAIRGMALDEVKKAEMRALVLTSHKT